MDNQGRWWTIKTGSGRSFLYCLGNFRRGGDFRFEVLLEKCPERRGRVMLNFDGLIKGIKPGQHKTMPPYSASIAVETTIRHKSWIFAAQFNKFVEIHRKIYYHLFVFCAGYAGSFWGGCSAKAPSFFNKKPLHQRLVYSDNISFL